MNKYEEWIKYREKLYRFYESGILWSDTTTHALVYIGQELNSLDSDYKFDFVLNVPFSEDLETDILAGKFTFEGFTFYECTIARFVPSELRDIARYLYLKKKHPTLNNNALRRIALNMFYMPKERFDNAVTASKKRPPLFARGVEKSDGKEKQHTNKTYREGDGIN